MFNNQFKFARNKNTSIQFCHKRLKILENLIEEFYFVKVIHKFRKECSIKVII